MKPRPGLDRCWTVVDLAVATQIALELSFRQGYAEVVEGKRDDGEGTADVRDEQPSRRVRNG